jgi:hypothetical protein
MPGGGGRQPLAADLVQWLGVVAFLCGGDQPWRTRVAGARSSQPYLGARGVALPRRHDD